MDIIKNLEGNKIDIPLWMKQNLTIKEAVVYSNIGEDKLREMLNEPGCSFLLKNGKKYLVKRREFEKYIESVRYL